MKTQVLLLGHSLKRVRTIVLAMGLLLGGFQVLLVAVARSIQDSNGFSQLGALMPPFMREMMGPSFASFMSFGGIVCLGYFHLVVMSSLVGLSIAIATTPTSEVETGFIDLVLSRPVTRRAIITRSILLMIICIATLLGLMLAGTWIGLALIAPKDAVWPETRTVLLLAGNLGLLMVCWSGIAMAIGAASRRRAVASGIAALLTLSMFLLDYLGHLWRPADRIAWISPFRYFVPLELLGGSALATKDVLVLAGAAVAGFMTAYVTFGRRDISH